jgi:hypothetical protein
MLKQWQRLQRKGGRTKGAVEQHSVVSQEEWLKQRLKLMEKEKRYLHAGDELAAEVRALPWVKVEKSYLFMSPQGEAILFDIVELPVKMWKARDNALKLFRGTDDTICELFKFVVKFRVFRQEIEHNRAPKIEMTASLHSCELVKCQCKWC